MRNRIYTILGAGLFLIGCSSNPTTGETETEQVSIQEIVEEEANVTYILPSPYQIAEMFRRAGLNYQTGITQSPDAVSQYNSSFQKNLAFGLYSADLAYVLVNKQSQEAITYLTVIRGLANDLGYGRVFDSESFFTRFEKNIGDEDSVAFLLGDLQLAMTDLLSQNNEDYISPIIFSAAWIESMYIGVHSYDRDKNSGLLSRLQEQKILLENVLASLQQQKNKFNGIPPLISLLEGIKTHFPDTDQEKLDIDKLRSAVNKARADITEARL